ncbi:MAG: hypothetical protein ACETWM_05155 [Candidatus Lokiarchaeia archaeon]
MPRLTKIAEKAREQETKEKVEDVSESSITDLKAKSETAVERVYESDGVKVVEKVIFRYTRKDPITLLDTNFNVRMPSKYLDLLKGRFGERGATVFCRIAILEKMEKEFSEGELDSLKFFELLDAQSQNLTKRS